MASHALSGLTTDPSTANDEKASLMSNHNGLSPLADAGAGIAEAEYANRLLSAIEGRPYVPLTDSKDPIVNFYFGALAVWYLWPFAAVALSLIALWWLGPVLLLMLIGFGIGSAVHAGSAGIVLGLVAGGIPGGVHLAHRIKKSQRKAALNAALAAEDKIRRSEPMPSYGPPPMGANPLPSEPAPTLLHGRARVQTVEALAVQGQQQALADLYAAQDERALKFGDTEPGRP